MKLNLIFMEITETEAKEIYVNGGQIYTATEAQPNCKRVPCSYEYGSHDTAETLFYRSIPTNRKTIRFFKKL